MLTPGRLNYIDNLLDRLMEVDNQQAKRIAELEASIDALQLRVKELEINHEKLRVHLDKVYHLWTQGFMFLDSALIIST